MPYSINEMSACFRDLHTFLLELVPQQREAILYVVVI